MRDQRSATFVSGLSGPPIYCRLVRNDLDEFEKVREILLRFAACYDQTVTFGLVHVNPTRSKHIEQMAKKLNVEERLDITPMSAAMAKGREFLAGIVVDDFTYPESWKTGRRNEVDQKQFQQLCGLYVGVSRFRDRVGCVYSSRLSPLSRAAG